MNRTLALLGCLAALTVGWMAYSRTSAPHAIARPNLVPKVDGSKVYFVPMDNFPTEDLQGLAQYYRDKYQLDITILKSIPIDLSARDESRQQLMAERLVQTVRSGVSEHGNDPAAILIGFTFEDIYPTTQNWQFAFGWRSSSSHAAVVSTARMSLQYVGEPLDLHLAETRLRKMVTKDIGVLYYGLPQSSNPRSVLYNQIDGIQELDDVGEEF